MADRYDRLRHIGYCIAKLPPKDEDIEFEDFIQFAKFELCMNTQTLMKDPIWEEYTAEEILVEYYASLFHKNKDLADAFIRRMSGIEDDEYQSFADWADEQDAEDAKILEGEEDSISFNPQELGD